MKREFGDKSVAGGVIGVLFLLPLLLINLTTSATANNVWVFGRKTHLGCWFREGFGIPCPTCGMTRSVVLTLHGDLATALQMNVGGVLAVSGLVVFGCLMTLSIFRKKSEAAFEKNAYQRWLISAATIYFGVATIISIAYWLLRIVYGFQPLP